ncbi:MAG: histidine phosphatase family protein [Pseudomonadota bacterium]
MTLVFLRHPRPAVAPGICYGRLDLADGPDAAREIAAALAATPPLAALWHSPARRTAALAAALATRDSLAPQVDARLHELDFGAWEGRAWAVIDRVESDPWAADPRRRAPPGGERFDDLLARLAAWLDDRAAAPGAMGPIGIVTHAGVIRAARMLVEGASFEAVFAEPVPYATPILLEATTPWPA